MNAALNWRVSKSPASVDRQSEIKALRYPIIILAMAIMVVVAMLHFVLPEFAAIYKTFNTPLPALTQGIMTLASLVANGVGCWCYSAFCWR